MLTYSAMICDRPQFNWRADDRNLKNKRGVRHFDWCTRCLGRGGENLPPQTGAAPGAQHAEAAEAVFAADLLRANKDRGLYLFRNLLPLSSIESLTRLNGNDLLILELEHDSAAFPRLRKIKRVRVGFAAIKLAGAADALIE